MVSVMRAVLIAAALATACPAAAAPMTVADLTWMEGLWIQAGERETVRETWLPAAGAQMVGVSQTDRPGARAFHEFMRIEANDGVVAFTALLEGQPPTAFPLLSARDGEVVFQNLEHDFPQRVIYRRCGADLCGRIEGTINGRSRTEDWRYTRVGPAR